MAPHELTTTKIGSLPSNFDIDAKLLNNFVLLNDKEHVKDYDFYRFLVGDLHGIARCKVVTKSAYMGGSPRKGPGMTWRVLLLAFDSFNNFEFTRSDGRPCTDARLMVEQSVPRPLAWAGGDHSVAALVCESWWGVDEQPQLACPRFIARRLCEELETDYKLQILHATEMEFTLFNEGGEPSCDEGGFLVAQEFACHEEEILQLSTMCEKAGIPIETLQTEYGPGQFEVVLKPTFGVEGADNEFLFRNIAKELLQKPGQPSRCTFMSKPIAGKVGNGSHFNHSLWRIKNNGDKEDAMWDGTEKCRLTKLAQHWLAGILKHSPALSGMLYFIKKFLYNFLIFKFD